MGDVGIRIGEGIATILAFLGASMANRTPLFGANPDVASGARIVPFGGWDHRQKQAKRKLEQSAEPYPTQRRNCNVKRGEAGRLLFHTLFTTTIVVVVCGRYI